MFKSAKSKSANRRGNITPVLATRPVNGSTFSPEFWDGFVKNYWEQRPVLIKQPFSPSLISPEEMFQALVQASDKHRIDRDDAALGFYIERAGPIAGVAEFLPRSGDRSTLGYARRVKRMLGRKHFALIVEDIHVHAPEIWLRFREFLCGLSQFTRSRLNRAR